jgi:hypothetical protein
MAAAEAVAFVLTKASVAKPIFPLAPLAVEWQSEPPQLAEIMADTSAYLTVEEEEVSSSSSSLSLPQAAMTIPVPTMNIDNNV